MVDLQPRRQHAASTQWLSKAIRLPDEVAELTALDLLYAGTNGKPDFDLTMDPSSDRTILVLTAEEFATVTRGLDELDIPFEEVPVKPMSDLPPEVRRHARGFRH